LLVGLIADLMRPIGQMPNKLSTTFGVHYAQGKAESGRIVRQRPNFWDYGVGYFVPLKRGYGSSA